MTTACVSSQGKASKLLSLERLICRFMINLTKSGWPSPDVVGKLLPICFTHRLSLLLLLLLLLHSFSTQPRRRDWGSR